ncbi:MAG: 2-amino-4-hydroxy-6-hydroxymethyldihydropteridine diphosphokinase [Oleiphilaceae bacterium]|jgi:2-amino-4-hydroxy-6-hydroxymethyldihydropteridine diphosphokinase
MLRKILIGLGSNLNSPIEQIQTAIKTLSFHKDVKILKSSSLYESLPQGPQDQDHFFNAAILIETELDPEALLLLLQTIELKQGKVKVRHWGERCIDLDILFIDQLIIHQSDPDLIIPHPHALTRDFVLIPTLEVAPDWRLPDQSLLKDHLASCIHHDLKKALYYP